MMVTMLDDGHINKSIIKYNKNKKYNQYFLTCYDIALSSGNSAPLSDHTGGTTEGDESGICKSITSMTSSTSSLMFKPSPIATTGGKLF